MLCVSSNKVPVNLIVCGQDLRAACVRPEILTIGRL